MLHCRSASGKALTGHQKLDRSISGPLSVTAAAAAVMDDNEDSATNPAQPANEDEQGLSESEVRLARDTQVAAALLLLLLLLRLMMRKVKLTKTHPQPLPSRHHSGQ